jgi:hypothetical protein
MYKRYVAPNGNSGLVRDNGDGSLTYFLENPDNSDYQQYLKWLEEGNTPLPVEE